MITTCVINVHSSCIHSQMLLRITRSRLLGDFRHCSCRLIRGGGYVKGIDRRVTVIRVIGRSIRYDT